MWTVERIEQLRTLWADGYSCTQVGAIMGISRSAVIGAVHRNGLKEITRKLNADPILASRQPGGIASRKPRTSRAKPKPKPVFNFGSVWGAYPAEEYEPHVPRSTDIVPLNLDLMELTETTCRHPYGDGPFTFCGHPVKPEKPYCAAHCRINYMRPDARRNQPGKRLGGHIANFAEFLEAAE